MPFTIYQLDNGKLYYSRNNGLNTIKHKPNNIFIAFEDSVALELIDALEEAHGIGWLPYPENAPTEHRDYWVQLSDGQMLTAEWVCCECPYFWFVGSNKPVIAWRELPSPYQPREAE